MSDFQKNPEKPFEVPILNKIRKRIAMHEVRPDKLDKIKQLVGSETFNKITDSLKAITAKSTTPKRGSMWSRFTNGIKKFLR